MMSKGSKLLKGRDLASMVPKQYFLDRCVALMDMISERALLDSVALKELRYLLPQLYAASLDSSAKPSKKRPRTAKPRTSTRRKA